MAATAKDNLNGNISGVNDYSVEDDVYEQEIITEDHVPYQESSNRFLSSDEKSRVGNDFFSSSSLAGEIGGEEEGMQTCVAEGNDSVDSGTGHRPDGEAEAGNGEMEAGGFAFYWPDQSKKDNEGELDKNGVHTEESSCRSDVNNSDDDVCKLEKENFCYDDDNGCSHKINEVKDSLLDFATCNDHEYSSTQNGTTLARDDKVPYFEGDEVEKEEEEEVPESSGVSASQLATVHLSRETKEISDEHIYEEVCVEDSVVAMSNAGEECAENSSKNDNDLENKYSYTDGVSPKDEDLGQSLFEDYDLKGTECYLDPFESISDSSSRNNEGFCDEENVSVPIECTIKKEEKTKAKSNSKKEGNKKSKKNQEIKQIIDEDVLNEVKSLMEKQKVKSVKPVENGEDDEIAKEDEGKGKTKEKKKKKKKKAKRSSSKCEGSSPAPADESSVAAQGRRILHRGTVWKEKKGKLEDGDCSPASSNDRGNCSPGSRSPTSCNDPGNQIRTERGASSVNSDEGDSFSEIRCSRSHKIPSDLSNDGSKEEGEERLEIRPFIRDVTPPLMCSESNGKDGGDGNCDKNVYSDNDNVSDMMSSLINKDIDKSTTNESIDLNSLPTSNASNICELVNTSDEMAVTFGSQSCHIMGTPLADSTTDDIACTSNAWETSKSYLELMEDITDEFPEIGEKLQICRHPGLEAVVECKDVSGNEDSGCDAAGELRSEVIGSAENDYTSCNGADAFTFKTTVSLIKALNPSVEFVSDNSSPLSTRSSSLDRDTLASNKIATRDEGGNSSEEVSVPPLFDLANPSQLDGVSKLQMKYKKRHSIPKYKPSRRNFCISSKSFESDNSVPNPPDHSSKNWFDDGYDDKERLYENDCSEIYHNSHTYKSRHNMDESTAQVPMSINIDPVDGPGDTRIISPPKDDDSDDADGTWHPKNIKEKIKKIIGARLQPKPEPNADEKGDKQDAKDISPFPRSSTHSPSSKSSSETPDSGRSAKSSTPPKSASAKGTPPSKRASDKSLTPPKCASAQNGKQTHATAVCGSTQEGSRLSSGAEHEEEEEDARDEGKYQQKLSFNAEHLNLTYLTDSDEVPAPEGAAEEGFIQEFLNKEAAANDANPMTTLVERWDAMQRTAAERQRQSTQLRQLQRQVKALRLSMEGVVERCATHAHPHALDDPSQLGAKVEELKALVDETESLRSDLSALNVMVHRFSSEVGSSDTPLRDEMAELYRLWDETSRRVAGELSRMQSAEATWRLWEEQKTELSQALKQDSDTLKVIDAAIDNGRLTETVTASVHDVAKLLNERRQLPNGTAKGKSQVNTVELSLPNGKDAKINLKVEDRLSDSGTSGYESCSSDDLSERERRLAYLRRLARDLEASLVPGSKAWNDISSTLAEAEKELQGLQDQCRTLILRTAETLDPSSKQLASRFSSNSKRRNWARDGKSFVRSPRPERRNRGAVGGGGFRREWIWRVVRAALPFQAALLLLLCVACLLEPNCCDSVNTLNLSFTPQLRFVHGSPPI